MMCCCLVNHSSRHSLAELSAATSFSSSSRSSRSGSCSLQPLPPPQPPPPRWGNFPPLRDRLLHRPRGQPPAAGPPRPRPSSQPLPRRLGKFIPPALLPFLLLLFTPPPLPPSALPPGWLPLLPLPLPGCSSASRAGPQARKAPGSTHRSAAAAAASACRGQPPALGPAEFRAPSPAVPPRPAPAGAVRPAPRRPAASGWLALRLPRLSPRPRRDQSPEPLVSIRLREQEQLENFALVQEIPGALLPSHLSGELMSAALSKSALFEGPQEDMTRSQL
ncbi:uncharacterized protein V5649_007091 [Rhynchonycteris naso]